MKKLKFLAAILVACGAVFALASCSSKVSQGYADKISDAAKEDGKDTKYTYDKVMKDLGKEAIDCTTDAPIVGRNGAIVAVKGCKSKEDLKKKAEGDKDVEGLLVLITGGIAISATYGKIPAEYLK